MLTVTTIRDGAAATEYYVGGSAAIETDFGGELRSTWFGKGAAELHLKGEVTADVFTRLCANQHPATNEPLTCRTKPNRRIGYDLTFSVPKSVSLAWALAADRDILRATWTAAGLAIAEAEVLASTRVRKDGACMDRPTGNVVGAAFLHLLSRPVDGVADPQVHVHAVMFNATLDREEGRWKALQLGPVMDHAPLIQTIFHNELARQVQALGYQVTQSEFGWELDCVRRETAALFSKRAQTIEAIARENRLVDPKLKSGLGLITRDPKVEPRTVEAMRELWSARVAPEDLERLERGRAPSSARAKEGPTSEPEGPSSNERTQPPRTPSPESRTPSHIAGGPSLTPNELLLIERRVAEAFERSSVLRAFHLANEIMRAVPGRVTTREAFAYIRGMDVLVSKRRGVRYVTSRTVLANEDRLVDLYRQGLDQCGPLIGHDVAAPAQFSAEAMLGFRALAASKDRVVVLDTVAGAAQKELIAAFRASRGWFTSYVEVLGDGPGRRTSSAWMGRTPPESIAAILARDRSRGDTIPDVVWVSDAQRLRLSTASALCEWAERNDARIVIASEKGLRARPGRTSVVELLAWASPEGEGRVNVLRHQEVDLRDVTMKLSSGRGAEAIAALERDRLTVERPDALAALAARAARGLETGRPISVVTATQRESVLMTDAIRKQLLERGEISKPRVRQRADNHLADPELRANRLLYQRGQVVEFHQHCGMNRNAGTRWKVEAITPVGVVIRRLAQFQVVPLSKAEHFSVYSLTPIEVGKGDRIRLTRAVSASTEMQRAANQILGGATRSTRLGANTEHVVKGFNLRGEMVLSNGAVLPRDFAHFEHAYASVATDPRLRMADHVTLFATRDTVDELNAPRLFDVASRARRSFGIWTDDLSEIKRAAARDPGPATAHDVRDAQQEVAEPRAETRHHSRADRADRDSREATTRESRGQERNVESTTVRDESRHRTADERERAAERTRFEENRARERAARQRPLTSIQSDPRSARQRTRDRAKEFDR